MRPTSSQLGVASIDVETVTDPLFTLKRIIIEDTVFKAVLKFRDSNSNFSVDIVRQNQGGANRVRITRMWQTVVDDQGSPNTWGTSSYIFNHLFADNTTVEGKWEGNSNGHNSGFDDTVYDSVFNNGQSQASTAWEYNFNMLPDISLNPIQFTHVKATDVNGQTQDVDRVLQFEGMLF